MRWVSWLCATMLTVGVNGCLGTGMRMTAVWQAVRFDDETMAPDWVDPDPMPADFQPGPSGFEHHVMLRAQVEM